MQLKTLESITPEAEKIQSQYYGNVKMKFWEQERFEKRWNHVGSSPQQDWEKQSHWLSY